MGYKKWTHSQEQLRPDPRYNSKLVSKFINCLMHAGKKSVALRLVLRSGSETLTHSQADAVQAKILGSLKTHLGAELRS